MKIKIYDRKKAKEKVSKKDLSVLQKLVRNLIIRIKTYEDIKVPITNEIIEKVDFGIIEIKRISNKEFLILIKLEKAKSIQITLETLKEISITSLLLLKADEVYLETSEELNKKIQMFSISAFAVIVLASFFILKAIIKKN
jgi:hypothetical protein